MAEAIEQLADKIIGMEADAAMQLIREGGFAVRDNTHIDVVNDDYNTKRINIRCQGRSHRVRRRVSTGPDSRLGPSCAVMRS